MQIKSLANLAAKHKLVPFLGAGCSVGHLKVDWNSLSKELADEIGLIGEDNNLVIAQKYVDIRGRVAFCEFLKKKLLVSKFLDCNGTAVLAIMSLQLGVIYTTNQDNIFEKCAEKYGRKYLSIVGLEDLSKSAPGDGLYFKYHGDLNVPDSVVFTTTDYQRRIADKNNFLDIRLKSDLLAKNLLFVGYSFRDPNIQCLFAELHTVFGGKLPPAYMIALNYSKELSELCGEHGIIIIDPKSKFPSAKSNIEAFELYISKLVEEVWGRKIHAEIDSLFRPSVPGSQRVPTMYEIGVLKVQCANSEFAAACKLFRGLIDQAVVPKDFEADVLSVFIELAKKCSNKEESNALNAALFNLRLSVPILYAQAIAAVMATANVRGEERVFSVSDKGFNINHRVLFATMAISLLVSWGRNITDSFRRCAINWAQDSSPLEDFPPAMASDILCNYNVAWAGKTVLSNPLKMPRVASVLPRKTFAEIRDEMLNELPKIFNKPYED